MKTKTIDGIELGRTYRDTVLGYQGVATSVHIYLTGCTRVCLEWRSKDGDQKDICMDVIRLVPVAGDASPIPQAETDPGGPGDPPAAPRAPR